MNKESEYSTVKVKLDDIDKLNSLFSDICVLTYLGDLVFANIDDKIVFNKKFGPIDRSAAMYLREKQIETVSQLYELLYSPEFTISE